VDVEAIQADDDDTSSNNDDQEDDDVLLREESNSVPWVGAIELLMLLGFVSVLRKSP
jgi:hypothetical protein